MPYKPKEAAFKNEMVGNIDDLGYLVAEFEVLEPDPNYSFDGRKMPSKDAWPIVEISSGPVIGGLPHLFKSLMNSTWKLTEPKANAARGPMIMGMRGQLNGPDSTAYHPQVRPTEAVVSVAFGAKTSIASDWNVFDQLKRVNAVTFRGDTRPPLAVIKKAGGFFPPNSRTDQYYLENNVYNEFESYLTRRYKRQLTKQDFLRAVNSNVHSEADKRLLVDYMMWRQICEREAAHVGRMASNECLKGYISTARAIDTSISFGTKYNSQPGWLYVTVVHGGFVVPWGKKTLWGTEEAEIAQWGPVPAERIVGFRRLDQFKPQGPIYFRREFRKKEPKAFEYIFKAMSGKLP